MVDLTTQYLGFKLKNPLVASSGPYSKDVGHILEMEDAGISAVCLHSLFEEQIQIEASELDRFLSEGTESFAESLSYYPDLHNYNVGLEGYLEHVRKAKEAVDIPVIASLNGVSLGGWIEYAKRIEQAGADALELNIYHLPTDAGVDPATVEKMYTDLVSHVKACVGIPVAVKLGPMFTSIPSMVKRIDNCNADGLVLFNRFYQADFDIEALEAVPNLVLSNSSELPMRLHWTAMMYGQVRADIGITGGVHTAEDVLKSMMAGARAAMMTSSLLRHGIAYVTKLEKDVAEWLESHEYESIRQMQGSMSYGKVANKSAFERGNYMKVLSSYVLRAGAR